MRFANSMIWHKIHKYLPSFLFLCGLGLISFGIIADYLLIGGKTGFGSRQFAIVLMGIVISGYGIFLTFPIGRRTLSLESTKSFQSRGAISILFIAVWFGLLTGFGELLILVYRKFLQNQIISMARDFVWMIPLGDMVIFIAVGLIFSLLARRWVKLSSLGITVLIFSFMGFSSLLFMFSGLHTLAALVLSFGLAITLARYVSSHSSGFGWFVRISFPGMAITIVVVLFGSFVWKTILEQQALARLPSESPRSTNVLFIVLDTVRAQNLSVYGYDRPTTPEMERLAEMGAIFNRAYSTSSWTLPAHFSMFNGIWPRESRENHWTYPTLAEELLSEGYYTAGFVANTFYGSYEHGLNRGFIHYEDYTISPEQIILSPSIAHQITSEIQKLIGNRRFYLPKTAGDVNRDFFHWLSRHEDRPFFVFLNYMDAHYPYLSPEPFNSTFETVGTRAKLKIKPRRQWSEKEIQAEIDAYDGAIKYLDFELGRLFDELENRDLINNTLVIIVSDHGELFGEHGLFDHGNSLYIQTLQVPLLIIYPGEVPQGVMIDAPVGLQDLPQTIVDLIGFDRTIQFPGISMSRFWNDSNEEDFNYPGPVFSELIPNVVMQDWYPIAKGKMESLIFDQYHYIKNGDGSEELYEIKQDPQEAHNLINFKDLGKELDNFRVYLDTFLE